MKTLHRSVGRGLSAGEPLPAPYAALEARRALMRRGSIYMVAGPPGSMKTMWALNCVGRIKVPTMYFSNDSDDFTMASRVLAMQTGRPMSETEGWTKTHVEYAQANLRGFDHVKWSFHSGPSLDHIEREMDAFAEINGRYPEHTVIDILMNVDYPGAGEQNYWGVMAELHDLSRKWETALGIIHHTSEAVKGEPCPPRHAIMGKANQLPTLIVTVSPDPLDQSKFDAAVVKNRFGEADVTGRTYFQLPMEPWCCRINEDEDGGSESGLPASRVDAPANNGARTLFGDGIS